MSAPRKSTNVRRLATLLRDGTTLWGMPQYDGDACDELAHFLARHGVLALCKATVPEDDVLLEVLNRLGYATVVPVLPWLRCLARGTR